MFLVCIMLDIFSFLLGVFLTFLIFHFFQKPEKIMVVPVSHPELTTYCRSRLNSESIKLRSAIRQVDLVTSKSYVYVTYEPSDDIKCMPIRDMVKFYSNLVSDSRFLMIDEIRSYAVVINSEEVDVHGINYELVV